MNKVNYVERPIKFVTFVEDDYPLDKENLLFLILKTEIMQKVSEFAWLFRHRVQTQFCYDNKLE